MAISAATVHEVRNGGNDANSGGFVPGGGGTDRTLQDSPHVTIDGATITATVNATTTLLDIVGYTVLAGDKDNTVLIAGGTMTAGLYHITAADTGNNRWTIDRSGGTAGQTGTGRMGGAKASPGSALENAVDGNTAWIKYNATPFDISSTTANVANGRLSVTFADFIVQGYDSARGDFTANRPTLRATTNTMTLVSISGIGSRVGNLILDAASATGITGVNTGASSLTFRVKCMAMNSSASFSCTAGSQLVQCEATTGSVDGFLLNGATLVGCVATANTDDAFTANTNLNTCIDCVAAGNTGAGTDGFLNAGATSRLICVGCVSYDNGQVGFNNAGQDQSCLWVDCIAESNANNGFGSANTSCAFNCAAFDNGTNYASGTVQFDCQTLTGSPFTSAAGNDFSLNNTAGGGAACREAGLLGGAFPSLLSTTGFADIGPAQHQAVTTTIFKAAVGRWSF